MGFMDGMGTGVDAFTKNFLSTYTTLNEQARLEEERKQRAQMQAQQMQMQQMQMQAMQQEQARKGQYQQAIQGLMAPQPGMSQADALAASGQVPEMWNPVNYDTGESGLTALGQQAVDKAMAPTPAQFTMQDYMQKVVPYLPESQQVEIIKEQMKPREGKNINEQELLLRAANGDPAALKAIELKQQLAMGEKKAPTGYRYTASGEMEPVPGGPADWQKQQKQQAAYSKVTEINAGLDMISQTAEALRNAAGLNGIVGIRGKIPNIPGSDAANAAAMLDTLKAQTGLTVLANLKAATGAGLGQVTESEHRLLQNYLTQLDTKQDITSFKSSLNKIVEYAAGAKTRMQAGFDGLYGEKAALQSSAVANVEPLIQKAAQTHGVPGDLIKAVAKIESNFNPNAKNPSSTAAGVMQMVKGTQREMGVTNPYDPEQSINGGAKYLALQMQKFGDMPSAVAAYYAGPARIETLKRLWPNDWQARLKPDEKDYVTKVIKQFEGYQKAGQQSQQPAQAPQNGGLIPYKRVG
jgi:hypothetical protein